MNKYTITTAEYTNAADLRSAVVSAFEKIADAHLEELRKAYIAAGLVALQDAYRNDNGIGYDLTTPGAVTFFLLVRGAETEGEHYICEFAGEAAAAMQDWEETEEFGEYITEAYCNGATEETALRIARDYAIGRETWRFCEFAAINTTAAEAMGEHLPAILAALAR